MNKKLKKKISVKENERYRTEVQGTEVKKERETHREKERAIESRRRGKGMG